MTETAICGLYRITHEVPPHLADWELPPGWKWGTEGVSADHRHFQEIIDALGRSLSLVSAPDPAHHDWLGSEARHLAHRNHATIPTTYHFWVRQTSRGPGYLRRWIAGERVGAKISRLGTYDIQSAIQLLRTTGGALAYLHDNATVHGGIAPETVWVNPTGRLWLLGWHWAVPQADVPEGVQPPSRFIPWPAEWFAAGAWRPTPASDQWQLGALGFAALAGELPPHNDPPPIQLIRPEVPDSVAAVIDRSLRPDPAARHGSIAAFLRAMDRVIGSRTMVIAAQDDPVGPPPTDTEEARLRWAAGDDYEVRASLGSGTFGSVWRVRDLALEREVALKMLHPHIARDQRAVARFRREAQLAAQLAHPAIVPIYDFDGRSDVQWYTMELAEGGSVADLVSRAGPRPLGEVAPQVEHVLDGLMAAHASGIVHRDLKPENILIDRYRRWRITDFGIANAAWEELRTSTTGTPEFAAPEQLLGEPQTASVDCFAMAGIIVFALSGTLPFGTGDEKVILARQLTGQVDLSAFPDEIEAFLRRALAPDPRNRYADATDMQLAWREALRRAYTRDEHLPWWRRLLAMEAEPAQSFPERRQARRAAR